MEPHFVKSVAEINQDIEKLNGDLARLISARDTLVDLYSGETVLPAVQAPAPRTPAKAPAQTPRRKAAATTGDWKGQPFDVRSPQTVAAAVATGKRAPTAEMIKAMAAARQCPEPFTTDSLMVATGMDRKFVSNRIWTWVRQGYVEKSAERGAFRRAAAFPSETPHE